ncbi:MAG: GGDEF domain-containing protein [Lachnospiraceae bacterium]|nr:GGDEF domain-containing protein [Lachnospiraceae bacterium]
MKKKKNETRNEILSLIRYIVPTVVLLVYIIVMVVAASSREKESGRVYAEEKLLEYDRAIVEKLNYELSGIKVDAEAVASTVNGAEGDTPAMSLILDLIEEGKAIEGYIIDDKGMAKDTKGENLDVSGEDWFRQVTEGTSGGRSTITEARLEGEDYIISIAAPSQDGKHLVVIRVSADIFRSIPSVSEFDGKTQYLFIRSDGNVMSTVGGRGLFKGGNIFDGSLMYSGISLADLKKTIAEDHIGIAPCTSAGEERVLVYRPMKLNGWKVCELATESYIDSEIAKYFAPSKGAYIRIIVALIIFLAFIVAMNIIIRMFYKQDQKKLKSKAETDLLTGVLNKISTEQTIQDYLEMVGEEEPGMFLLFDIDNFKKINDTRGHAFGDEVLAAIGKELPTIYRTTDIVGRLGGDEFCVFLKDIPNENARIHMGEVTYNFFRDFKVGEYTKYDVTASIGAAMFPKDGRDFEELYRSADKAVYAAKEHGRNRLVFYGEEPED